MSTTITESQNINNKGTRPYRKPWELEEKWMGRGFERNCKKSKANLIKAANSRFPGEACGLLVYNTETETIEAKLYVPSRERRIREGIGILYKLAAENRPISASEFSDEQLSLMAEVLKLYKELLESYFDLDARLLGFSKAEYNSFDNFLRGKIKLSGKKLSKIGSRAYKDLICTTYFDGLELWESTRPEPHEIFLGLFHSHPEMTGPSGTDLSCDKNNCINEWVIATSAAKPGEMKLYRIRGRKYVEFDIDKYSTGGNVSMAVSSSRIKTDIGAHKGNLSLSAKYNNDSLIPSKLSKTTLSYERDFFDRYARWGVFGGAYLLDNSEKVYGNFLGGTLKSKLGTFSGEIQTGDQYSLGYSTKGTWIGDLLAMQLDFMLTKTGETFIYSGYFKTGPIAILPSNYFCGTEMSINDFNAFTLNISGMMGQRINERSIAGVAIEQEVCTKSIPDAIVEEHVYRGIYSLFYKLSYRNFIFRPSIGFEHSEDPGIHSAISLSKQF